MSRYEKNYGKRFRFKTYHFFVPFFSNFVKKGNFPGMGNSPGMSNIPWEYYGNGNEIFKAEIVIFPGTGYSRGMRMRPHENGNSRTSHISVCTCK